MEVQKGNHKSIRGSPEHATVITAHRRSSAWDVKTQPMPLKPLTQAAAAAKEGPGPHPKKPCLQRYAQAAPALDF